MKFEYITKVPYYIHIALWCVYTILYIFKHIFIYFSGMKKVFKHSLNSLIVYATSKTKIIALSSSAI